MPALAFEDIYFSYGAESFIQRFSCLLQRGELVGLMGPNGSGKSTILRLAAGLLSSHQGSVLIAGRPVASYRGKERAGLIAFLPQILDMQAPFRVGELVKMGVDSNCSRSGLTVDEAVQHVGLVEKINSFLTDLSGGERRRAYIAMTLAQGAKLLLLDEPLANLDLKYQVELLRLLRSISRSKGITVFISSHDIWTAALLDRILIVKKGAVLAEGNVANVLTDEIVRNAYDLDDSITIRPDGIVG